MARLCFKYGVVHSGKSQEMEFLKQRFLKYSIPVFVMAPVIYHGTEIASYDYLIGKDENIYKTVKQQFAHLQCIFIADSHLLEKRHVDQLLQIVVSLNIAVICYGLRTDFRTNGFSGAGRLLELSHVVIEMKSRCRCGEQAVFSVRKINGKVTFCGEQVAKGEQVSYEGLCPNCYYRKLAQYKKLKESARI